VLQCVLRAAACEAMRASTSFWSTYLRHQVSVCCGVCGSSCQCTQCVAVCVAVTSECKNKGTHVVVVHLLAERHQVSVCCSVLQCVLQFVLQCVLHCVLQYVLQCVLQRVLQRVLQCAPFCGAPWTP